MIPVDVFLNRELIRSKGWRIGLAIGSNETTAGAAANRSTASGAASSKNLKNLTQTWKLLVELEASIVAKHVVRCFLPG